MLELLSSGVQLLLLASGVQLLLSKLLGSTAGEQLVELLLNRAASDCIAGEPKKKLYVVKE